MLLLCKSVLDGDILSLNPAKLAQLLPERLQEDRDTRSSALSRKPMRKIFPACCASAGTEISNEQLPEPDDNGFHHGLVSDVFADN